MVLQRVSKGGLLQSFFCQVLQIFFSSLQLGTRPGNLLKQEFGCVLLGSCDPSETLAVPSAVSKMSTYLHLHIIIFCDNLVLMRIPN